VGIVRIIVGRGAATFRPSAFQPRLPAHARTRAGTISLGARKIKVLFFEKKKQKTFARWHTRSISTWATYPNRQKFFGSFFQKRTFLPS
jgi:hypothetical protein